MKDPDFRFTDTEPGTRPLAVRDRLSWVETSFTEKSSQEFLGVSIPESTLKLFFGCICLVFFLFFCRALYLQVIQGRGFSILAERNKVKAQILPAKRGVFYDRNGKPLVWNIPDFSLAITQSELPKDPLAKEKELESLAQLLNQPKDDIMQALEGKNIYQPAIAVDSMDYEQSLQLRVRIAEFPGVNLEVSERREYDSTSTPSLSHVLGYTGRISESELAKHPDRYHLNDIVGKEGLELSYENIIHGKAGEKRLEVDALGSEKRVIGEDLPEDGKNIILTLDQDIQIRAEKALRDTLDVFKKKKGVVIVSDPKTGDILAMVSLPSYDNTKFSGGLSSKEYQKLLSDQDKPLFNRAVFGEYPSGSTIKMIVAAAALQEKVVTPATQFRSTGGIRIGAWFFPDWKAGGHGLTNVVKALAQSVNTYFYTVGGGYGDVKGLGVDRLVSYFKKFGLGEQTGIDILGERSGFVPSVEWKESTKNEPWYIGDTYHISIGQGDVSVTPLQVNEYTQYFANSGTSYKPHFLKKISTDQASLSPDRQAEVYKKDIVSKEVVRTIRQGLRETVLSGSARRLSSIPVPVAGKTGTAQWGVNKEPHAWFTGWAPFENPEIAITVLVEEGEEGSRTATPVAYDLLKWYFTERKNAHPQFK